MSSSLDRMARIAMLIPDVNLLVYAYNEDAPFHAAAKAWWETRLSGNEPVGLSWVAMLGFVRIMSNRRALIRPMPLVEAVGHCRSWLAKPNVQVITPGPSHLDILADLLAGRVPHDWALGRRRALRPGLGSLRSLRPGRNAGSTSMDKR